MGARAAAVAKPQSAARVPSKPVKVTGARTARRVDKEQATADDRLDMLAAAGLENDSDKDNDSDTPLVLAKSPPVVAVPTVRAPPQTAVAVADAVTPFLPPGSQEEGQKVDIKTHHKNTKEEPFYQVRLPAGSYAIRSMREPARTGAKGKLVFVIGHLLQGSRESIIAGPDFKGKIPYHSYAPE